MSLSEGDRYDSQPRARSKFESIGSRYDEDPRGPIRPYSDAIEEDSNKGTHNSSSEQTTEKEG